MKPRNAFAFASVGWSCFFFGLFGAGLGALAYGLGVTLMGDSTVGQAVYILDQIAFWPYFFLRLLTPQQLFDQLLSRHWFFLEAVGWGLLGVPIGWWRAKRQLSRVIRIGNLRTEL